MDPTQLARLITSTIHQEVIHADTLTRHRSPLVGFAVVSDPRFAALQDLVDPTHLLPEELLPGARGVVSFFLPFECGVVIANLAHREKVATEWARAYVETNALINGITARMIDLLAGYGVRAATVPATHNFDPVTLVSRWSHKSVAVIAGLGSFGLHHQIITDAGCAGRFGSLVLDADLPITQAEPVERCLYYHDGSCMECIHACPVAALNEDGTIDKQRCWLRVLEVAQEFDYMGSADVCGKCSLGPCALESAV